jgi:hypothetical protein
MEIQYDMYFKDFSDDINSQLHINIHARAHALTHTHTHTRAYPGVGIGSIDCATIISDMSRHHPMDRGRLNILIGKN